MNGGIHILFVDDQWCDPVHPFIEEEYGALQEGKSPYIFHYETAKMANGRYGSDPVIRRIKQLGRIDAVVLDIMFGHNADRLGLKILRHIRREFPILPVIMMTSLDEDNEVVVEAMEYGANEYIVKKPTELELERVLRTYTRPATMEGNYAIWGNSPAIRKVRSLIARIALGGAASVVITGESGTGKELVARAIHRQGPRRNKPFIDKNCAYEDSNILESDLCGHEKGAFTDAVRQHKGRIERANGGVLFLDEVGSMPIQFQGKLLRILENRCFQRLGGTENIFSDFQLISATNEDLRKKIAEDQFREDFYHRINQLEIHVPPLRERKEDIPVLIDLFIRRFKEGAGASYRANAFSPGAVRAMTQYHWPGNIRELKNVVERSIILASTGSMGLEDLPSDITGGRGAITDVSSAEETGTPALTPEPDQWPVQRLKAELQLALEVKRHILKYKPGNQWRAEFMKRMYPNYGARSAKGFGDVLKKISGSAWSIEDFDKYEELTHLLHMLKK